MVLNVLRGIAATLVSIAAVLHITYYVPEHRLPESRFVYKMSHNRAFRGGGTGFQIAYQGSLIGFVTNDHICDAGKKFMWAKNSFDGHIITLRIVRQTERDDLCLLSPMKAVRWIGGIELGSSPVLGDIVYILGHPELGGLARTSGKVQNMSRVDIGLNKGSEDCVKDWYELKTIQTMYGPIERCYVIRWAWHATALVRPGSSGSPVMGVDGKLVGVVFALKRGGGANVYFIDVNKVKVFLAEELLKQVESYR